MSDLVRKEYIEVFTIKSDERAFLDPHSSVSFPIEFSAPIAGTFQEEYTIVFDQNHPEVLKFFFTKKGFDQSLFFSSLVAFFHSCSIT